MKAGKSISTLVGKNHPDLYWAIKEIQKEQADTEIMSKMSLECKIKATPKKK